MTVWTITKLVCTCDKLPSCPFRTNRILSILFLLLLLISFGILKLSRFDFSTRYAAHTSSPLRPTFAGMSTGHTLWKECVGSMGYHETVFECDISVFINMKNKLSNNLTREQSGLSLGASFSVVSYQVQGADGNSQTLCNAEKL